MLIGFLVTTTWRMEETANMLYKQTLTGVEDCELGGQFPISHHERTSHVTNKTGLRSERILWHHLSIYGSTALRWALAAFSISSFLPSR
jgi:hypothetical protein